MKNIRHRYVFYFTGESGNSRVEIKGGSIKDIYHRLMWWEPVLQNLRDRSRKCMIWEYHKGQNNGCWVTKTHDNGFLPSHILSDKHYNYLIRHGL